MKNKKLIEPETRFVLIVIVTGLIAFCMGLYRLGVRI